MIKKKRFQLVPLCFLCVLLVIFTLAAEKAEAICSIDPNGTYIEAEHFSGSYNLASPVRNRNRFVIVNNGAANGGRALRSGNGGYAADTPGNEVKEYTVNFTETGTYYIWMRGRAVNWARDSMFFTVDDDPWKAWNFGGIFRRYIWTNSLQVGTGSFINITTTGVHTIKIAMREPRTRIDGFYITKGSETPTDSTVPSGVTSINPAGGCTGVHWAVDPATLGPSSFEGYNAGSMSFTITNDGDGNDSDTATVTSDQSWAVVVNGSVPALDEDGTHTVTVNFNTSGLTAGTYTAELTITGSALNSPLIVPITLLVKDVPSSAACGEIPLYAENLVNPAIMVQLDTSGSMSTQMVIDTDGHTQSRINIAENVLAEVFLDRSISWGFATWAGGSCRTTDSDQAPTYYTTYRVGVHDHDAAHQTALQDHVDDGHASGCTPLAPTMRGGLEYFQGARNDQYYQEHYNSLSCQPRIMVIVTDGYGNTATDNTRIDAAVDDLIAEGISIVAVGFGLTNATQLDRIVQKMKVAGEADDEDYLYHLHKEVCSNTAYDNQTDCESNGGTWRAVPFMAQNRQEFIDAMNNIVSSVKAQVFHGSSPAPTTSADNGEILLTASFDASDWSGDITATQFDAFSGALQATHLWEASEQMPATDSINGFISDASGTVTAYDTDSINGDNFLCKPMGDIINSTPVIVGSPPFYYPFDSYFDFKYKDFDSSATGYDAREAIAYVGANDGALHAFRLSDGVEQWRFYPYSVTAKMALAGTNPQDDMCSPSYCHQFLLDGSPQPADIYVNSTTGWRTILTTGLGEGGSAFFALDVTYGKDFDEPNDGTQVIKSAFLWEFTETDDGEIGLATSWPSIARVRDTDTNGTGSGWATYFGSGRAVNELQQANKEAYLFAVNSWDKTTVWTDGAATPNPIYRIKLVSGTQLNDEPAPPLVIDTQNDDYLADRIYLGNMYGDMYRVHDIGFGETPVSELLFNSANTDHSTPITAKAGYAYAGDDNNDGVSDIWLYFGTGKYRDQIDKFTVDQQYFYGLFDAGAAEATPYIQSDLVEITTEIVEAYALDEDGNRVDLNGDNTVDSDDLRQYRTLSCPSPDNNGNCNPNNDSWVLKLAIPADSASERTISQPLVVGGIVFFTTFVPDGDVCEGNGDTWLFAVDWQSGEFVSNEVFDINESGGFDSGDRNIQDTSGDTKKVAGIYIGTGKPSGELAIHNDILFVGTTGQPPKPIKVNLPEQRVRLRSWQQVFN